MSNLVNRVRNAWQDLAARERSLIIVASFLFIIFVVYFAIIRPIQTKTNQMELNNARLMKDYQIIKNYKPSHNNNSNNQLVDRTASVEKAVDKLGKQFGVPISKLSRIGDKTSVEMGKTDSATLFYFLNELERSYDIQVMSIEIEPSDQEIKVRNLILGRYKKQ